METLDKDINELQVWKRTIELTNPSGNLKSEICKRIDKILDKAKISVKEMEKEKDPR